MGTLSIWHIMIFAIFAVLLFGRGKISELMGDFAKGIKSFRKGMSDEETPPKTLTSDPKEVRPTKPEETHAS